MFSKTKSLQSYTCGQIFCVDFQWQVFYPLKSKQDARLALGRLHHDYEVFHTLIPDNAMELINGDFKYKALWSGSNMQTVEAYSRIQNLAESAIRYLHLMRLMCYGITAWS
jgi:hypothetical protein